MKQYKLLKDLPTFKAGQLAYISEQGSLIAGNPDKPEITDAGVQLMMYHKTTLDKFPEILTEWFEEIKEPTDSIHWKPKPGEKHWYMDSDGDIYDNTFDGECLFRRRRFEFGNTYPTEEACRKAKERKLAEVRLRRTSDFKPDFENGEGGWTVFFSYMHKELHPIRESYSDSGEPVRYATEEEAKKSIRENREDWLIYFGIKEEE